MPQMIEYKCPNCGGTLDFNSTIQKMKCPFCDTEIEMDALQAEHETEKETHFQWHNESENTWDEEDGMDVYTCQSCNGEIIADRTTGATKCPYCGNNVVLSHQFKGALKPDLVVPFKLDKKQAKEALARHVSNKKLLPSSFKEENHIDEIKGVYVPTWCFDADATGQARFRGTRVRSFRQGNYQVTHTDYYSIFRGGNMSFHHIPMDGSRKMDDTLMESLEPFDLTQAVDFKTAYLSGYLADKYDVGMDECLPHIHERITNTMTEQLQSTVLGYSSIQVVGQSVQVEDGACHYALLPVWLLSTTYQDKNYLFAMNGQTGQIVGDLPMDKGKYFTGLFRNFAIISAIIYGILMMIGG